LGTLLSSAEQNPDARVIFAKSPSGAHPLCAVVRRALLPAIEAALKEGRLSVNELFHNTEHIEVIFEDEEPFLNLNTPEDLTIWEVRNNAR
jgi:molybdopterin-guanine dinucleotide biosynthesis protein A